MKTARPRGGEGRLVAGLDWNAPRSLHWERGHCRFPSGERREQRCICSDKDELRDDTIPQSQKIINKGILRCESKRMMEVKVQVMVWGSRQGAVSNRQVYV